MQSNHDLNAVVLKQRPIIPTNKACPYSFQRIGEANPSLTMDIKLDGLGNPELFLLSGGFISLLKRQVSWNRAVVNVRNLLAFFFSSVVRIRGLYGPFRIG